MLTLRRRRRRIDRKSLGTMYPWPDLPPAPPAAVRVLAVRPHPEIEYAACWQFDRPVNADYPRFAAFRIGGQEATDGTQEAPDLLVLAHSLIIAPGQVWQCEADSGIVGPDGEPLEPESGIVVA